MLEKVSADRAPANSALGQDLGNQATHCRESLSGNCLSQFGIHDESAQNQCAWWRERNRETTSGGCYAARLVSALLIHFAISAELAPILNRDRTSRSRETERSPASIFAIRDWLDPGKWASAVCVSPRFSLTSFTPAARANFISMNWASSVLNSRKSAASPTVQRELPRRRFYSVFMASPS